MPRLVRLYLVSIACGIGLGLCFTALLILFDVAGLRHLLLASASGKIAIVMLVIFHSLLFSGVQFGIAIMRLATDDQDRGGKILQNHPPMPRPVLLWRQGNKAPVKV